jgi:myo-inositol-1(or 4)-monophosphatase
MRRGEWKDFANGCFTLQAMGSIAYKLALVAAGLADITFTLTPKNEWDVVGGAALVRSAGGFVSTLERTELVANRRDPRLRGLLACAPGLRDQVLDLLAPYVRVPASGVPFSSRSL